MEELLAASVHINFAGELCPGRPLVPLLPPSSKADVVGLAGKTTLTNRADNNDESQREDNSC